MSGMDLDGAVGLRPPREGTPQVFWCGCVAKTLKPTSVIFDTLLQTS